MRVAVRRHAVRAVQVLLFVAGLLVLGLVLGGAAQAAERTGAESSLERVVADDMTDRLDGTLTAAPVNPVEPVKPMAGRVREPVARGAGAAAVEPAVKRAAAPVAERIVEPVGDHFAEPLGQAVAVAVQTAVQSMPERPMPASSVEWPGAGQVVPTAVPVPVAAPAQIPAALPVSVPGQHLTPEGPAAADAALTAPSPQSPDMTSGQHRAPLAAALSGREGRLPPAPGHAPAMPGGSAVLQTAGDGHMQRVVDPKGAWFSRAASCARIPGSRQPAGGAGPRERHRDILEFPG
ncbi:hypothetical protein ABZ532_07380 [Streptomyces sp. NPDC019396]|uniref:hypothetical protein n=1 Tax=Streptomyces sp. NPDC019396 TaxID=3154687 RepID=UPI0033EA5318